MKMLHLYEMHNLLKQSLEDKLKSCSNITRICKLCFNTNDTLFLLQDTCNEAIPPRFKFNLSVTPMMEILQYYIGEDEKADILLPSDGVCQDCMWSIYKSYDFMTYCRFTQGILRDWIRKSVSEIKSTIFEEDTLCLDSATDFFKIEHIQEMDCSSVTNDSKSDRKTKSMPLHTKKSSAVDQEIEEALIIGPHICSICREEYSNAKKLLEHRKSHGKTKYQCVKCGKGFTTSRGVRIHMRQHYNARPEICLTCGAAFSDPRTLKMHHATNHKGLRPYECNDCGKRFSKKIPLQLHIKTHTGDRPHVCDVCGKSYIQANSLVVHKRLHSGEKPYNCDLCFKSFTNSSSLKMHHHVHTAVKDLICSVCGKRMARTSELNIHMRIHTGYKPFECQFCHKTFISSSALRSHKVTHSSDKRYICSICNQRFLRSCDLNTHLLTHSAGRSTINCRVCAAALSSVAALRKHNKIHTGEKRFLCPYCDRAFAESYVLKNHIRTHTGEKPFTCAICMRSFAQPATWKMHLKVHMNQSRPSNIDTHCQEVNLQPIPCTFT